MYRVLIIDDDKLARNGLISMVQWEKYGLEVAGDVANGLLALEFLKTHEVDLAFVDLSMPVLSGMDFIREARKLYPKLKYVVLTFHEDFENVQNALRCGVLDYISKLRLEEMVGDEVFSRIGRLMKEADGKTDGMRRQLSIGDTESCKDMEIAYEKMEELRRKWCTGFWIYDDKVYRTDLRELQTLNISIRQLERLLLWISQKAAADFQISLQDVWINEKEEGFRWLQATRDQLRKTARNLKDYQNIPFCILSAAVYVEDHIEEKNNSGDIAKKVNMSRSYFSTNFRLVTGETFNDFVRRERMERAREILRMHPQIRIADLAEMVGYEEPKYFVKLFQQDTGKGVRDLQNKNSDNESENGQNAHERMI